MSRDRNVRCCRSAALLAIVLLLAGCHLDGPFIPDGQGVTGLLQAGTYVTEEIPPDQGDKPETMAITIADDAYVMDGKERIRVVQLHEVRLAEISSVNDKDGSRSVLLAKLEITQGAVDLIPVQEAKFQALLHANRERWQMKTVRSAIAKDGNDRYQLTGTQAQKLAVLGEIAAHHLDIFAGGKTYRLRRRE